jgi:lysophospholipase L1-like esterase
MRLTQLAKVLIINVGLLIAGCAAIEIAFGQWIADAAFPPVRIPRDELRLYDASQYYAGGGMVVYRRDRYGLRGRYESPATIDILAIGGSTTNEQYVSEGETWTDVLAARFRSSGRPLSVVNAGLDGQSTAGLLRNFDTWFPRIPGLHARYVLVYAGINDAAVDGGFHDQYDDLLPTSPWSRIRYMVNERSALYHLYRAIDGMIVARRARLIHQEVDWKAVVWREIAIPVGLAVPPDVERIRQGFAGRLARLIARIRAFGAQAIIVSQHRGTYYRRDGRLMVAAEGPLSGGYGDYVLQSAMNETAMSVCRTANAICVDLGSELDFEPGDFADYVHTTPAGSGRIGRYLYERLARAID